jgi:hypothetical protein
VRKVIVATNIAETSVTLSGVRFVVDTGKVKVRAFSGDGGPGAAASAGGRGGGIETLSTIDVSKAQATQRAGRAGREGPGECFRLYTEDAFAGMPDQPVPEIQRVSLASVLLQLLAMGMCGKEALTFPFPEPVPPASQRRALVLLRDLGAVASVQPPGASLPVSAPRQQAPRAPLAAAVPASAAAATTAAAPPVVDFGLTEVGTRMAALPLDPQLASLLLAGASEGAGVEAAAIVAVLSVDGVWVNPGRSKQGALDAARRRFASLEGDHITLLNVFRAYERMVRNAVSDSLKALAPSAAAAAPGAIVTIAAYDNDRAGHGAPAPLEGRSVGHAPSADAESVDAMLAAWAGRRPAPSLRGRGASSAAPPAFASSARAVEDGVRAAAAAAEAAASSALGGAGQHLPAPAPKKAARTFLQRVQSASTSWCWENFVSFRALRKAVAIRDQIAALCEAMGVALASCGDETDRLRRALLLGCFPNVARRQPGAEGGGRPEYRVLASGLDVSIHPSS